MRRFTMAFAAVLAVAGLGTAAQAREVSGSSADNSGAVSGQAQGSQQGTKTGVRKLHRAGTPTAGSDSFLPMLGSVFVSSAFAGSFTSAVVESNRSPASPE